MGKKSVLLEDTTMSDIIKLKTTTYYNSVKRSKKEILTINRTKVKNLSVTCCVACEKIKTKILIVHFKESYLGVLILIPHWTFPTVTPSS